MGYRRYGAARTSPGWPRNSAMINLSTLKHTAEEGLRYLRRQKDIQEVEVFVANNTSLTARLNYTSHIPCNGVEEPKSTESYGVGVRAVFQDSHSLRIGMGSESGGLSLNGVKAALEKARRALIRYHDASAMDLKDADLVQAGWRILTRALDEFTTASRRKALTKGSTKLRDIGLIIGGDV